MIFLSQKISFNIFRSILCSGTIINVSLSLFIYIYIGHLTFLVLIFFIFFLCFFQKSLLFHAFKHLFQSSEYARTVDKSDNTRYVVVWRKMTPNPIQFLSFSPGLLRWLLCRNIKCHILYRRTPFCICWRERPHGPCLVSSSL